MPRVLGWTREPADLPVRNRRTALVLVGWIVFLCLVSLVVIWVRN